MKINDNKINLNALFGSGYRGFFTRYFGVIHTFLATIHPRFFASGMNGIAINRNNFFLIILLICFFATAAIVYEYKSLVYVKLGELKLLPVKEHFTELYFDNPFPLSYKTAGGENIDYSFTIHNLEGIDKEYFYIVYYESDAGSTEILDQNTIFVKNNEKITIKKFIIFLNNIAEGKVYVELPELKQKIDFILKHEK